VSKDAPFSRRDFVKFAAGAALGLSKDVQAAATGAN
jgi:hypothetical protein